MNLFKGWCSSSWPTSSPTMEALALPRLHCKRSFHVVFHLAFSWTGSPCSKPPWSICLSGPACCSMEITCGAREVWTLSSQRSATVSPFLMLLYFPLTAPFSVRLHSGFLQLLEQLENTGPPPAEKEMISLLPTVCISQEQTGNTRKVWPE